MITSFSELPLCPTLKGNLAKQGFVQPTEVQALTIEPALAGRDLVATAQTGTGKTLAFVLPIIERLTAQPVPGISAIIMTPTRELAIQINETFLKMASGTGLRATVAVGGLSEQTQLNSIRRNSQVIIATPGRLFDFVGRKLIDTSKVRILVLDEADRMLDMGFLPTVKKLMSAMPASRQTLFFSATIEASVKHLINDQLRSPERITVGSTTKPISSVELGVFEVHPDRKLSLLTHLLNEDQGSFLVFSRTRHGADKLSKKLSIAGVKTGVIHGDRSQSQRNQALRGFQDGYYRVLVATDVAARGIHVEGISHVVNFDLPQVPEDFVHRVGRTGRAGAKGIASTFAAPGERGEIVKIERTLGIKLTRKVTPAGLEAEQKQSAQVIVMPTPVSRPQHSQRQHDQDGQNRRGKARSFGPAGKTRRRRAG